LPDSGMIATRVGFMRAVVCASPQLLDRLGTPRTPEDMTRWPSVDFDYRSRAPSWTFRLDGAKGHVQVETRPRLSVTGAEAAVSAAISGVGATRLLHYQCAEAVRAGALRIVLAEFEVEPLPVHLLHVEGKPIPLKTRAFLEFATERLRERMRAI
jgi:DNA-binding transcriptional LysR family regulator